MAPPGEITLETVKQHNKPNDLWIVIEDKVYNLTKFRNEVCPLFGWYLLEISKK